jgi:tetratricopeptide (TPR) repeat protein
MELMQQLKAGGNKGLDSFVDTLFKVSRRQSLTLIHQQTEALKTEPEGKEKEHLVLLLECFGNFFLSEISVFEKADFQRGFQQLQKAIAGFEQLGRQQLKDFAQGMLTYFAAIIDIKRGNVSSGIDKMSAVKKQFDELDQYGQYYAHLIDSFEAERHFITGTQLVGALDYEKGLIEMEKAFRLQKRLTIQHMQKGTIEYRLNMGTAYIYATFAAYFVQWKNLSSFNFDYFDYTENELADEAMKAIDLLSGVVEVSEITRINLNLTKGIKVLSSVIFDVGQNMHRLLMSDTDEIQFDPRALKSAIRNARDFFTEIGDSGLVLLRSTNVVKQQIENLEKILRIKKVPLQKGGSESVWVKEAQEMIAEGKLSQTIKYLMTHLNDYDVFEQLILISGSYHRLVAKRNLKQITEEVFSVEENKVSRALLAALDSMQDL